MQGRQKCQHSQSLKTKLLMQTHSTGYYFILIEHPIGMEWFGQSKAYSIHHLVSDLGWRREEEQGPTQRQGALLQFHFFPTTFFLFPPPGLLTPLPVYLLIRGTGKIKHSISFCSQCKVYSRCTTRILSCPRALTVFCYSSWLKSVVCLSCTGCIGKGVCFLAKPSTWTDAEKKPKQTFFRQLLLTEEQLDSRGTLPFFSPFLRCGNQLL